MVASFLKLRTLAGDNIRGEQLGRDKYEPIFERNKVDFTGFDILNDLLILENQIPKTTSIRA